MPASFSPSVAKQAAMYGRQIQIGPRGLLGSLNPFWVPLPQAPGSVVTNDHHEIAQVEVNNTSNQFTNSGTSEGGLPTSETDFSSLIVQASPVQTAQDEIQRILRDYLQVSEVDNVVIEEVIECTFSETNGLFAGFILEVETKVFNKHEDLPAYEWDIPSKVKILQKDSRFKSTLCSRGDHLEILHGYLEKCDKFF